MKCRIIIYKASQWGWDISNHWTFFRSSVPLHLLGPMGICFLRPLASKPVLLTLPTELHSFRATIELIQHNEIPPAFLFLGLPSTPRQCLELTLWNTPKQSELSERDNVTLGNGESIRSFHPHMTCSQAEGDNTVFHEGNSFSWNQCLGFITPPTRLSFVVRERLHLGIQK